MVSTRSHRKQTDLSDNAKNDADTQTSHSLPPPAQKLQSDSEDDSDDEAPEAISTSTAKSLALHTEQVEREAKAK
jgi:hypothetical protein